LPEQLKRFFRQLQHEAYSRVSLRGAAVTEHGIDTIRE
jgi:hypothetical protein